MIDANPTNFQSEVIDAGGRFVIPGLWDNHTHFTNWALTLTQVNVEHIGSTAEMADFVGAWMREHDPVHRSAYGYWLLTRYDDVAAALRDPRLSICT